MRNPLIYAVTIFLLVLGTTAQAQEFNPQKNNYLILSKNINQLKHVLTTAEELVETDGEKFGVFHVIICGKTVKNISNNNNFTQLLDKAKESNVKVLVCGLSLKQFDINPTELPKNLPVVANGILYGLQYTKKGFITLSI